MYTLPSRDTVVQTCRGVGQVLLYYVQNVWEWRGWCGISLIYPYIYISLLTHPPDIILIFDIVIAHNGDEPLKDYL